MTESEIVQTIGAPTIAGDHVIIQYREFRWGGGPEGGKEWIGEKYAVYIWFDADGRATKLSVGNVGHLEDN